jgi:hypothetical protein
MPFKFANCGRMINIGRTAKSWTTRKPIITLLANVVVTPADASVLRTIIVLEREIMAPNQIASVGGIPRIDEPAMAPAAHVMTI